MSGFGTFCLPTHPCQSEDRACPSPLYYSLKSASILFLKCYALHSFLHWLNIIPFYPPYKNVQASSLLIKYFPYFHLDWSEVYSHQRKWEREKKRKDLCGCYFSPHMYCTCSLKMKIRFSHKNIWTKILYCIIHLSGKHLEHNDLTNLQPERKENKI